MNTRREELAERWRAIKSLPHYDRLKLAVLCLLSIGTPPTSIMDATGIASTHLDDLANLYLEEKDK